MRAIAAPACRPAGAVYDGYMPKRTSPGDAENITVADDLQHLVRDKREGWRANAAKARRRQRHYNKLLTQQLTKLGSQAAADDDDPGGFFTVGN